MRAIAADRHGDLDQLALRELPRPTPGRGQLLIEVKAAAVNPADLKVLSHTGGGGLLHASAFPLVPGFDVSGVVAEVGPGTATDLAVGDEVYGFLPYSSRNRRGSFAEAVVVDADEVGRKPRSLDHPQAAAAATAAISALQALRDKGRLRAGDAALIHGASGGVGSYAVQVARALGASVVATASVAKRAHVEALGAERVLDYRADDVAALGPRFRTVLDASPNNAFGPLAGLLAPGGTYVSTVPNGSVLLGFLRTLPSSRRVRVFIARSRRRDLEQLAAWFDGGQLTSAVDRVFPLAEAAAALAYLRSGAARGKIALTI